MHFRNAPIPGPLVSSTLAFLRPVNQSLYRFALFLLLYNYRNHQVDYVITVCVKLLLYLALDRLSLDTKGSVVLSAVASGGDSYLIPISYSSKFDAQNVWGLRMDRSCAMMDRSCAVKRSGP